MKKSKQIMVLSGALLLFTGNSTFSRENIHDPSIHHSTQKALAAGCSPASAIVDLDINNVRAKIISGGDAWWDLVSNAGYEIPKGSGKTSIYAGSLWIGGLDAASQLKVAAQTYRQSGNDYFPGPLSSAGTIDAATCTTYNRLWKLDRADVIAYHNWIVGGSVGSCPVSATAQQNIEEWPAFGPEGQTLAPFHDSNADGLYDAAAGDYPNFNLDGTNPCGADLLYGDQAIWWVFNDAGNTHTETGGAAIGLEIQAQAFAYSTTGYLNDATFYNYRIINKSSMALNNTYIGQWLDPDLGDYSDDYVGCNVITGMGYAYNGGLSDVIYGNTPPAVGFALLHGPAEDPDLLDNPAETVTGGGDGYGDSVVDDEYLGISKFIYYNNDASNYGNPTSAMHYYNYLRGIWKDNTPLTYGGDGHSGTLAADYMYPGHTDPVGIGVGGSYSAPSAQPNWSEDSIPDMPGDRRFVQSSGPFTFQPGQVCRIATAIVWAQAASGGPHASVQELFAAKNAAQQLFNNCFIIPASTGITEHTAGQLAVKLYPNPFYDQATLSFEKVKGATYSLKVYDLSGKLVRLYSNISGSEITITKNELKAGTYMYALSDAEKQVAAGKFIIR